MNKAQSRRMQLLQGDNTDSYTKEDLNILWLEYRIGKQYVCFGEFCDHISAFNLAHESFSLIAEYKGAEVKSGSAFWLTCIERPHWWTEAELI